MALDDKIFTIAGTGYFVWRVLQLGAWYNLLVWNDSLTQTKQRKTLKKNLICAILNTVAQAANFDTIGGNYYVQI